jgi:hypothetical protein
MGEWGMGNGEWGIGVYTLMARTIGIHKKTTRIWYNKGSTLMARLIRESSQKNTPKPFQKTKLSFF